MNKDTSNEDTTLTLFDEFERSLQEQQRYSASSFQFLNRSPWESAETLRKTLEYWFSKLPLEERRDLQKRKDLQRRFRADDRQHSGALLELLTHELLSRRCQEVAIDPEICGGTPDFSAVYDGTRFIVECTVTQESKQQYSKHRMEQTVLDVIDSIDAGPYMLMVEFRRVGSRQPAHKFLKTFLEGQLASLDIEEIRSEGLAGHLLDNPIIWRWEDWDLRFGAIALETVHGDSVVGGRRERAKRVVDDETIDRALQTKSDKYHWPNQPYLVVISQRRGRGNEETLMDALLGPQNWVVTEDWERAFSHRSFKGFFGAPDKPKNQHVSAVLFKRNLESAWQIRNQWTSFNLDQGTSYQPSDWTLVHHPEALTPLPEGIFPFAVEYIWRQGRLFRFNPNLTLNSVLGLEEDWPGEEH